MNLTLNEFHSSLRTSCVNIPPQAITAVTVVIANATKVKYFMMCLTDEERNWKLSVSYYVNYQAIKKTIF